MNPVCALFTRRRQKATQTPSTIGFRSVRAWLQAETPIFIPCFNNRTYVTMMLGQLKRTGFRRIIFVDNASSAPDMRAWLDGLGAEADVVAMDENLGPWHIVKDPANLELMPGRFCLTDPDIAFNPDLPADFLNQLASLTQREQVGKAGFALDIHDRAAMKNDLFQFGDQHMRIWDWEEKFWRRPLEPLPGGDPVFNAPIDTTFALYDRRFYDPDTFYPAVRVAGRFTAQHLPWLREHGVPADEAAVYANTEKFSNYAKK